VVSKRMPRETAVEFSTFGSLRESGRRSMVGGRARRGPGLQKIEMPLAMIG